MIEHDPRLLIIGGSSRAAAQSALRAGFHPICADLYGDLDLIRQSHTIVHRIENLDAAARDIARAVPVVPRVFTGGVENHRETVRILAETGPLWGCHVADLSALRSPFALAACLSKRDIASLPLRPASDPPPRDGTWLLKSSRGTGGQQVHHWNESCPSPVGPAWYFQRYQPGLACSGQFLATAAGPRLFAVMQQLIGCSPGCSGHFSYCGSILWTEPPSALMTQLQQMATAVCASTQLRGLFGIDLLWDGDTAWLSEVNPRWTASMELYELAGGPNLLTAHCKTFQTDRSRIASEANSLPKLDPCRTQSIGKLVHFADRRHLIGDWSGWLRSATEIDALSLADLPVPGSELQPGWPICTSYVRGSSLEQVRSRLLQRATRFNDLLPRWNRPAR